MIFSSETSPIFAIAILLAAFLTAYILNKIKPSKQFQKYRSLDGFRGLAAIFVFLHHSSIWYFYKQSNKWVVPPSKLYTQFGQGAVTIFFMMTAFLFYGKIRESSRIDWISLYSARIMRLAPLYYFITIIIIILAIFVSKNPILHIPSLEDCLHYFLFSLGGTPNLFGVKDTFIFSAGVTWTLPYEWFFYLSLPGIFIVTKRLKSQKRLYYLIIPLWILFALYMSRHFLGVRELTIFIFGIAAYEIYRLQKFNTIKRFATGNYGSLLAIIALLVVIFKFNTAYNYYALFLYFIIFLIISLGNNIGGLLTSGPARKLGEISYSIYLLQGFILYIAFGLLVPTKQTPSHYWFVDLLCVVILIISSQLTFYFIEYKLMEKHEYLSKKIKSLLRMSYSKHSN